MPMDSQRSDRGQAQAEAPELKLDLALDAARIGVWEWDPATGAMSCNRRMKKIFGMPQDAPATFEAFLAQICCDDRSRARSALLQAFRDGASRSVECRLADSNGGLDRWITIEGRPCALADASMRMLGTARDISARKAADAQSELAVREMEHRIQNVFAVIAAVVSLSERRATTPRQLALALETRIGALARAHALLRRARSGGTVALREVIASELAPFTDLSNMSIHGANIELGSRQAVAMNVIVHELATNAVKYGALSRTGGRLSIDWTVESSMSIDCLVLRWQEHCNHPIAPPSAGGLGRKFLTASARASLRGDISLEFERTGLLAMLVAPVAHLTEKSRA